MCQNVNASIFFNANLPACKYFFAILMCQNVNVPIDFYENFKNAKIEFFET